MILAGNPARPLRPRFTSDIVDAMTRIARWDWPHDGLKSAMLDIRSLDAGAFCANFAIRA